MNEEPPGSCSICTLLERENNLFRLTLNIIEEKQASAALINAESFADVAAAVFKDERAGIKRAPWDFSVLLCGDELIRSLNKQYRGIDAPTDVLSFEIGGEYEDERAGKAFFCASEIVISLDRLAFNSDEFSVSKNEELKRLVIHGILHLSGMDHSDNTLEQEMLQIQESILKTLDGVTLLKEE